MGSVALSALLVALPALLLPNYKETNSAKNCRECESVPLSHGAYRRNACEIEHRAR